MSVDQNGALRFSTIGKLAISLVVTTHIGIMAWILTQMIANGTALAGIQTEMAVRVEKADREHASYVSRGELAEIVKRLDERMADFADALRQQQRRSR